MKANLLEDFEALKTELDGELYTDNTTRILYSTDASAYQEMPQAVVVPRNKKDIKRCIEFAQKHKTSIIPRAAGTSLAGQVVGHGIVLDISKYIDQILELNKDEKWVWVQPGVNLDELNKYLKPHGLFFAPETSTSNRCRIGGMMGNNSCGSHSVIYGSTREHVIEVEGFLSDGSEVNFGPLSIEEFEAKCREEGLEGKIYRELKAILSNPENSEEIRKEYPDPSNPRKNTGYALDILLDTEPFTQDGTQFNMCKLLAGSEGTLAFITAIKLNLVPVPPKSVGVVCAHFNTLDDALRANIIALKYKPGAVELMDDIIMNCTKNNITQQKNRFFVQGDPKAMLMIEFARETEEEIGQIAKDMELEMRDAGYGYHFPVVYGNETSKVWELRKAGLGLLANVPGDKKSVAFIEDTSVKVDVLPEYIIEFQEILEKYGLQCVFYAHVGSGELHLRPMLDLKIEEDVKLFHTIALEVAKLVKKYKGSLSGEHGDGRLRGEFIPLMLGQKIYQLLKLVKRTWDPTNIFNPGKIVDAPSMTTNLRYIAGKSSRKINTTFDFSKVEGILRATEMCTGSADCRKSEVFKGTMCPSFMATRDEKNSTRARANILRQFLTHSTKQNPFDHEEIYEVMDLCLSCKACKSECPSNVDVAKLKAEFLQQYYDEHGVPLRSKLIAFLPKLNKISAKMPGVANFFMTNKSTSSLFKRTVGFAQKRSIPTLYKTTLEKWNCCNRLRPEKEIKTVYLFNDEFTNFNDTEIGIKTILLLSKLGYKVILPKHEASARTFLSKGLLREAKKLARDNVKLLSKKITAETPLIGIEPSAILAFRDEYPELVGNDLAENANELANNSFLIDEFLANEMDNGNISKDSFTDEAKTIKLHGHCQQKSIASTDPSLKVLSFPKNYSVEEIPSGCCGMAGSFGYEKEHYDISMKIGELILFPEIRKTDEQTIIAAPGTSCRHQIKDGTGRDAKHPVEVLYEALINK